MLAWLAGLPPVAVYGLLALLAATENIFPPVPADTAVALGAFLSYRGVTSAWVVFAVTIIGNVGSAAAVYAAARRLGPRFSASRIGRRLLPPAVFALVEREYLRWGLPAIFLCRLLPGVRAIVPPFTGLVGLSPRRALIPIVAASALWYGAITIAGVLLGAQWDYLIAILDTVNRALAIGGGVAIVVIALWIWRRSRQRSGPPVAGVVVDRVLGTVLPEDPPA
ncbi:MAG: DedA family protein [Gemmatimonadales bacterium]